MASVTFYPCGIYKRRVVGEITIKFISILIIFTTTSGDYKEVLEEMKFEDKDETNYYNSLVFCADLVYKRVWHLGYHQNLFIGPFPEDKVDVVEVVDTVLLSLRGPRRGSGGSAASLP